MQDRPTILGIRADALFEIIGALLIILVTDYFIAAGGARFIAVQPHPFWIPILLVTVQYGVAEGILAVLLSTLALYVGNIPEQSIDQDRYEYLFSLSITPILWLVTSLFLGMLAERHIRERMRLEESLASAQERETTIATSYTRLKELKENLELRIAGQFRTTIEAYRAAKEMERLNPTDVFKGVQRLVSSVLNPEKFSVFTLAAGGLETTLTSGWKEEDNFHSFFDSNSPLYQSVTGGQKILCIANRDQEVILANQGVLAGPLIDAETGEVLGMLKVEKVGFLDLNVSSIDTFRTLCEWISMTLVNARRYQIAKSESMVNPDHNLMSYNYFQHYSDYTTSLAKRVGFDVSMVMVKLANSANLAEDRRRQAALLLSESVNATLRSVDLAFDYQTGGGEYAIVLPATNTSGARVVLDKITKDINERLRKINLRDAHFSFTVNALHAQQRIAG